MTRAGYLLKRLVLSVPVVVFGTSITFLVLFAGPIDPAGAILRSQGGTGPGAARIREQLGLHQPLWSQYVDFMAGLATLDVGQSWVIAPQTPAFEVVAHYLPRTLWLGVWALVLPLFVGIPLGLYAGLHPNTPGDYLASFGGIVWRAMPNFWLAVVLVTVLSSSEAVFFGFDWEGFLVPTTVVGPPPLDQLFGPATLFGVVPLPNWGNVAVATKKVLPAALVLGSASMGNEMRIARTATLETKREAHVDLAKAKGLPRRTVVRKHVLRNALLPLLPVISAEAFVLVGGSVLVEYVFAINGIGYVFFRAMTQGDLPLAGALMFVFVLLLVAVNVLQDLLYTVVDPRVGFGGRSR